MPEPKTLLPQFRIDGWITALGPLRIGDGEESKTRINRTKKDDQPVPVQTVCADHLGRAYLPGTGLRGFLRAYAKARITNGALLGALFGYQKQRKPDEQFADAMGGLLTVWDAPADMRNLPRAVAEPFWNGERATCVASHVALDRVRRTAAENLLFFEEYVPAGVRFSATFLLEGGAMNGLGGEDYAAVLLKLLDEVKGSEARLGACNAAGWGHVEWTLDEVRQLKPESFRAWSANPGTPLLNHYKRVDRPAAPNQGWWQGGVSDLRFEVNIRLAGPLLVNDPDHSKQKDDPANSEKPNHYALRRGENRPALPASSVHGALRAQAERIARTLAGTRAAELVFDPAALKQGRPPVVRSVGELEALDAVSCLFGAPGWRSPLRVTEFDLAPGSAAPEAARQEFVAIDRFTGGGADERKFNAEPFAATGAEGFSMHGTIALDLRALDTLAAARSAPATGEGAMAGWEGVLWLLKYVLRDLEEGDIGFGAGRSKGYGACTVTVQMAPIEQFPANPEMAQALRKVFLQTPQARSIAI
jgi:CRISPR/Cas system CSM-associated protein Csm3 (group 7 of RAMP superfamily)